MYIADSSTAHAVLCISVQNLKRKLLTVPARLQTHCTLCTLAVSTHLHMYILYYKNRKMDVSLDRPVKMTTTAFHFTMVKGDTTWKNHCNTWN